MIRKEWLAFESYLQMCSFLQHCTCESIMIAVFAHGINNNNIYLTRFQFNVFFQLSHQYLWQMLSFLSLVSETFPNLFGQLGCHSSYMGRANGWSGQPQPLNKLDLVQINCQDYLTIMKIMMIFDENDICDFLSQGSHLFF